MAEYRSFSAWLGVLAGVLLALASCSMQLSAAPRADGAAIFDATTVGQAPQLPGLQTQARTTTPLRKASGQVMQNVPGDEPWAVADNVVLDTEAHTVQLSAGTGEFSWAIYGFAGLSANAELRAIRATFSGSPPEKLWVGLANYTAQLWQWSEVAPVDGAVEMALPAGTDWRNSAESSFIALGVWDSAAATIGGCLLQGYQFNPDALGDWPMLGHDARRTSRTGADGIAAPKLKWSIPLAQGSGSSSSPVIGPGGIVYLNDYEGSLCAYSPAGTRLWSCALPGTRGSSPAIDDESSAYLGCTGYVCAVAADGVLKWSFVCPGFKYSSPALGADGTVYIGAMAFSHSGILLWGDPLAEESTRYTPAVAADGTVYFNRADGYLLTAVHPDGSLYWQSCPNDTMSNCGPLIGDDAKLYTNCNTSWEQSLIRAVFPNGQTDWFAGSDGAGLALSPAGDIVYGGLGLTAVTPAGNLLWENSRELNNMTRPAITGDGMIYTVHDNTLWATNPDGTAAWNLQLGATSHLSSPAIALDGTVYVSGGGTLFAIGSAAL